ncbi:MAG: hypothetical protein DIJKHBIC_03341 [Thermoanaerobaculia bacterium]|nr:hypothetical protein [Thermoanaerobaculia bacterium]
MTATLRRLHSEFPEFVIAAVLFAALTALSWRRWASFEGDLNREWTTPARIAAGERLYKDVAYYYGPLVPWTEGAAYALFGSRTGTALGFGLALGMGLITLVLVVSRPLLTPWSRIASASVITGVFAFAPHNGALIAPYSLSAVAAMTLSWGAIGAAYRQRETLAGVLMGFALLAKVEAAPVCVLVLLLLPPRLVLRTGGLAGAIAIAGYGWAVRGLAVPDLVTFGPLRHAVMPEEFRELYLRISGLHASMRWGAILGVLAGASLILGWFVLAEAWRRRTFAERPALIDTSAAEASSRLPFWGGGILLGAGAILWILRWPEPLLTTVVRGLPALTAAGAAVALAGLRLPSRRRLDLPIATRLAVVICLTGLAFLWRTILWVVPSYPYAPLAAISAVPAAAYLLRRISPGGLLAWLPVVLAPVVMFPRLVDFYRGPRVEIRTERALWYVPADSGEVQAQVLSHLLEVGVKDRSLVVLPEASALNFVLGARSPLRLEQALPGLLDDRADAALLAELEHARPERVAWLERATPEFGGQRFGRDYGRRCAEFLSREYVVERRFSAAGRTGAVVAEAVVTAAVLRRKDLPGRSPAQPERPRQ